MTQQAPMIEGVFQRAEEMGLLPELANLSRLEDKRIHAIRDGAPLSSTEFELLCRALAVDSGAMYAGSASIPKRSPARFRAATAAESPNPTDIRLLALAAEQGRILGHLLSLSGKTVPLSRYRRSVGVEGNETWRQGYQLGESAREALAPTGGPLYDLPSLLNQSGVHVARVSMSPGIDAASIWEPDAVPVLLINANNHHVINHPGIFRACLAHELCHLLHDAGERNLTTRVSWGLEGKGNYHENLEVRARAFAPAFLSPRNYIQSWYDGLNPELKTNSIKMVQILAETWGFSFEGAAWHAQNCGLIEPQEADRLAELQRKPLISLENFEIQEDDYPLSMVHKTLPERTPALWRGWASIVVLEALEEGHISLGRAREILTWN